MATATKKTRPNIIFVLCDNVGWGDFSCYGGSTPTPRIDQLASEDIRLTNCEGIAEPILQPQFPMVFDLGSDPGERYNLFNAKLDMGWMLGIAFRTVAAYEKSIAQYPNIKPGQEFTGYKTALPKSA